MQKMLSLKAVIERNLRETTGKIESEMKEVKDKLASLTAAVEKCIGQLLETERKWFITCISSQAHWAEIVVVVWAWRLTSVDQFYAILRALIRDVGYARSDHLDVLSQIIVSIKVFLPRFLVL